MPDGIAMRIKEIIISFPLQKQIPRAVAQQSHDHKENRTPHERISILGENECDIEQIVKQCATCLEYQPT